MSEMQWKPISEWCVVGIDKCDLYCLKKGCIVSILFKGKSIPENYQYDIGGVFLQHYPGGSIGKSLGVLKERGATHFMVYEFSEGEE